MHVRPTNQHFDGHDGVEAVLDYYGLVHDLLAFPLAAVRTPGSSWWESFEAYLRVATTGQARLWSDRVDARSQIEGERVADIRYGMKHYGVLELADRYLESRLLPHVDAEIAELCGHVLRFCELMARAQHELMHLEPMEGEVPLTPAERDVLTNVARGQSVEESAAHLGVGAATVRSHLKHVYDKLDVHNAHDAVLRADASGLIDWLRLPVLEVTLDSGRGGATGHPTRISRYDSSCLLPLS